MIGTSWTFTDVFAVILALFAVTYTYIRWKLGFWKRLGLPHLEPRIPFGNLPNVITNKQTIGLVMTDWYRQLKSRGLKIAGVYMFTRPMVATCDPEIVRLVLTKDFQHFVDRGIYTNEKDDPISANLFVSTGQKWRHLRVQLTPTFTSGKMKMMFPLVEDCANNFLKKLDEFAGQTRGVDIKDILSRFTTDAICSCAFGLECNSCFNEDEEFRKFGKALLEPSLKNTFRFLVGLSFPKLAHFLGVRSFDKDLSDYFINLVKQNVDYRNQKNVVRNDFFQLLLDIQKKAQDRGEVFTLEEFAAEVVLFFIAGFETSSTLMTYTLYLLAINPDVQEKLRQEILEAVGDKVDNFTYENNIQGMSYLGQVLDEALRLFPSVPFLIRQCTQDWTAPDGTFTVKKGQEFIIPTYGFQHDAEYFPDPEKFVPDRFSNENKAQIPLHTYLPFGEGPRNCIGLRFGLMQSRLGIAKVLQHFRVTLNEKTQRPMRFEPRSALLTTLGGIHLNVEKIAGK